VGHGFSRMLSMLKPELITKSQQVGIVQQRGYYDEDARMVIEEEDAAQGLARTQAQSSQGRRPNTAHVLPTVPRSKVLLPPSL
jgi:hypothetical protein